MSWTYMIALQMNVHQTPGCSGLHGDQVLGLNGVWSIYSSWLGAILAAKLTIVCDALRSSKASSWHRGTLTYLCVRLILLNIGNLKALDYIVI